MIRGARARGQIACSSIAPMQILQGRLLIGIPGVTLRRNEAYPKELKMKRVFDILLPDDGATLQHGLRKESATASRLFHSARGR
jgi:hypothetical protein